MPENERPGDDGRRGRRQRGHGGGGGGHGVPALQRAAGLWPAARRADTAALRRRVPPLRAAEARPSPHGLRRGHQREVTRDISAGGGTGSTAAAAATTTTMPAAVPAAV